ncbi:SAV_6107 family HEPN domain-containing protein [Stackebrandtia nassauensis]|uniref:SAV_6107 family HEPN domain-containing protein n=1 Tax=Stackebrandtia nassauensis TaxID=283811 RepID=UPI003CC6FBE4
MPEIPAQTTTDRDRKAIPARSMPNRSPLELLILARQGLAEAAEEPHDGPRYATAHLAALRAAAAVLAIRARPVAGHRSQVTNVWSLLIQVAPELREWAEFFAATARKRTMAQAGVASVVTAREADDLLRDADHFVSVVTDLIGLR